MTNEESLRLYRSFNIKQLYRYRSLPSLKPIQHIFDVLLIPLDKIPARKGAEDFIVYKTTRGEEYWSNIPELQSLNIHLEQNV